MKCRSQLGVAARDRALLFTRVHTAPSPRSGLSGASAVEKPVAIWLGIVIWLGIGYAAQ